MNMSHKWMVVWKIMLSGFFHGRLYRKFKFKLNLYIRNFLTALYSLNIEFSSSFNRKLQFFFFFSLNHRSSWLNFDFSFVFFWCRVGRCLKRRLTSREKKNMLFVAVLKSRQGQVFAGLQCHSDRYHRFAQQTASGRWGRRGGWRKWWGRWGWQRRRKMG